MAVLALFVTDWNCFVDADALSIFLFMESRNLSADVATPSRERLKRSISEVAFPSFIVTSIGKSATSTPL